MKKRFEKILDKITEFTNKAINDFGRAGLAKKILYIACAIAMFMFGGIITYLIIFYAREILTFTILTALYIFGTWLYEMDDSPHTDFSADQNAVYTCIHEAICEGASILKLEVPLSIRSIMLPQRPSSDNIPRFWAQAKKRQDNQGEIAVSEVRNVLNDEIQRIFVLNQMKFVTGIAGLYLDVCNDAGTYYELAVIPIHNDTSNYITSRERQIEMQRNSNNTAGNLYDDKL